MITNARVLTEEFVPDDVMYRDQETNELERALQHVLDGEPAQSSFIYGPSGTGKTCIAKFMLKQLREQVLDINSLYVNCWVDYNRYRVLYRLLEGINGTLDIHRQSTPKDELLKRLREYDGPPYVVILDEVDQLDDMRILYDLYSIRGISMILIANREEEFFVQLDDRIESRLHSARRINFDPYHNNELVGILRDRVNAGLRNDVIDAEGLRLIADRAAGDARKAISILRNAAREAQADHLDEITPDVIDKIVPKAKSEIQQNHLDRLRDEQRAICEIIEEEGEIEPSGLYELYEDRVDDPKSQRTVRNYLSKMQQYGLIEAMGEKRGRTYRAIRE